jgi:hypothetical protein
MAGGYPLENAIFQWESGIVHLRGLEGPAGRRAERVVRAVRDELRRRVGATFTAAELAGAYGEGTDWVDQLPVVEPGQSDLQLLVDAAFWQHLQVASDYAGGRLVEVED